MTSQITGELGSAFQAVKLDKQTANSFGFRLPSDFNASKTLLMHQAVLMLASLNDYDQQQVLKEITYIGIHPSKQSSLRHRHNPLRRIFRYAHPFRRYHYLISYKLTDNNRVVIEDIYFDEDAPGIKTSDCAERTMLYQVERGNGTRYDGSKTGEQVKNLAGAWENPQPTSHINTEHVAVNGMLNNLDKAAWLMGTHLDAAYANDSIKAYTLFHNPSDKAGLDLVESLFDKTKGNKSYNAQHLAAVMADQQRHGKKTKWVAHSQGVIIFMAALQHYQIHHRQPLLGHELAVHGSGVNVQRLTSLAQNLGVRVIAIRNNPFDIVPNIAGGNNRSAASFIRCARFVGLVTGDDVGASPHTLPFLGLTVYHRQLLALGDHQNAQKAEIFLKRAGQVKKYINKLKKSDPTSNFL